MTRIVAALYVDKHGPYPKMLGVQAWSKEYDAMRYIFPNPVVAHPPCGPWGNLLSACTKQDPETGVRAVIQVARFGGVLEHPAGSRLWKHMGLPLPGDMSDPGFYTIETEQCRWGHKALKKSWFLFSRIQRGDLLPIPPFIEPTHVIDSAPSKKKRGAPVRHLPKSQRHITPHRLAEWLIAAARKARA